MGIKGDLRLFHPIEVFQLIKANQETGILLVSSPSMLAGIYFVDGDVAFATKAEKMHDFFTKNRFSAFLKATEGKKPRGAGIKEEPWQEVVSTLMEIMGLKEGIFSFEEASFFLYENTAPTLIPSEMLIMEATRKSGDWEDVVGKKISSMELIFDKKPGWEDLAKKAELRPEEKKVLEVVGGDRNVDQIVSLTGLSTEEVTRTLFGLLCAGLIGRASRKLPMLKKKWLTRRLLSKLMDKIMRM